MKLFVEFEKVDEADDGSCLVYGYASTEALDSHGEIVRADAIQKALPDYLKFGNIREMHQPSAVGTTEDASMDGKGLYLCAKIVDPVAVLKCRSGVYKGFSIGGKATSRDPLNRSIITACKLSEISLVDRPANPDAVFDCVKAHELGGILEGEGSMTTKNATEEAAVAAIAKEIDPAAVVVAADPAVTMRKGMYGVARFAGLLEELRWFQDDANFEAALEGDNSDLPAKIKAWVGEGAKLLVLITTEEAQELVGAAGEIDVTDDMALMTKVSQIVRKMQIRKAAGMIPVTNDMITVEGATEVTGRVTSFLGMSVNFTQAGASMSAKWPGAAVKVTKDTDGQTNIWTLPAGTQLQQDDPVAKKGARHSKADLDRLQAIHDHAVGMGAGCAPADGGQAEKIAKAVLALPVGARETVSMLLKSAGGEADLGDAIAKGIIEQVEEEVDEAIAKGGSDLVSDLSAHDLLANFADKMLGDLKETIAKAVEPIPGLVEAVGKLGTDLSQVQDEAGKTADTLAKLADQPAPGKGRLFDVAKADDAQKPTGAKSASEALADLAKAAPSQRKAFSVL